MNKRELGKDKETVACDYLQGNGYEILERNFWSRYGEIDIIAKEGDVLVFLEVKYRKNNACGGVEYSISNRKKRTICQCAMYYQMKNAILDDFPMRFDVLLIEGEEIILIRNAFEL